MKECCSLWLVVSTGRCHLVWPLVRLNLVSLSFPISNLPPSVGRILSSSFSSVLVSRNTVVSLVPAWVQFELGQLGIFANSFVDSLGWLLQGEFVVFPWSFRWIPMSFSLLSFQMSLVGSTISPNDFRGALTGPMSFPSGVQVSVDVHAVHPSVRTSVWIGYQRGSLVLCWTRVHSTPWVAAWHCLGVERPLAPALDFEC